MTRGELWWADLGLPFESESGFAGPVVIVQDDSFNKSKINTVIIVPMTSNLALAEAPGNVLVEKKRNRIRKRLGLSGVTTLCD